MKLYFRNRDSKVAVLCRPRSKNQAGFPSDARRREAQIPISKPNRKVRERKFIFSKRIYGVNGLILANHLVTKKLLRRRSGLQRRRDHGRRQRLVPGRLRRPARLRRKRHRCSVRRGELGIRLRCSRRARRLRKNGVVFGLDFYNDERIKNKIKKDHNFIPEFIFSLNFAKTFSKKRKILK